MPSGASLTGIRVKYRDSSASDMQFTVVATDFADGGASADTAVSATRNYYLAVFSPAHTGELSFCGAEAQPAP